MNRNESAMAGKLLFYRIVALWAVCEGMLGGIIHGFNMPGTGLFVSSGSVICISLLAWYFPSKGVILKATLIVSIFKMLLSPHSPPTAYIAVFFQGVMGEILFANRRTFKLSCILLAVLALVESAIQRILVLTLIYGSGLWKAVNQFISKVTGEKHITNFSWYIAIGYVLLHLVVGIFIGRFASRLPAGLDQAAVPVNENEVTTAEVSRPKRSKKLALFVVWLCLLVLYIQSEFKLGNPLLPSSDVLQIIIRSVLVICLWYFILSPLLSLWLKSWLQKKQTGVKTDIAAILDMIPATQQVLVQSWRSSSEVKGFRRLGSFARLALTRTITKGQ
jgi:hypothetical protein